MVNRRAVISNRLDRMDYVGHNGLVGQAKGPFWWRLGPPEKSGVGICSPLPSPKWRLWPGSRRYFHFDVICTS